MGTMNGRIGKTIEKNVGCGLVFRATRFSGGLLPGQAQGFVVHGIREPEDVLISELIERRTHVRNQAGLLCSDQEANRAADLEPTFSY